MRKSQIVAPVLLAMLYSCRSAPQVITIDSTPSNASITIDNQFVGNTPVVYTLPKTQARAKNLVIRAEKNGYEEGAKLLTKKGRRFEPTVYLKLERLPQRPQTQFVGVPASQQPAVNLQFNTNQNQQNTSAPPVINNAGVNNNNAGSANNSSNGGGNGGGNGGNRR